MSTILQQPSSTSTGFTNETANSSGAESSYGSNSNYSFVGSTPSTVLFFLALGVGIAIALLFVFFTIRYFIRSKYGLNMNPINRRNFYTNLSRNDTNSPINQHSFAHIFTTTEIQEQLDYIRDHNFIRGEIIEQRLANSNLDNDTRRRRRRRRQRRIRRRRRRQRFSKLKRLSMEEVELLFPKKTYHDWLNGGKERDVENREGKLKEEEDGIIDEESFHSAHETNLNQPLSSDIEMKKITPPILIKEIIEEEEPEEIDLANQSNIKLETFQSLHFDSGSCAICLELLEIDDIVRGLICGHVFHQVCLDPWLIKRRACCPMCKRDYLFKRDYHQIQEGSSENNNLQQINQQHNNEEEQNDNDNDTNNDSDDDDDSSIDIDDIRNDPTLQAMIQDLIPTSERVRIILNDPEYQQLNLEEQGKSISNKKYGKFPKIIWWKIMGISKLNLFNWAILNLVHQYRLEHPILSENNQEPSQEQPQEPQQEDDEVDLSENRRDLVENRV